MDIYKKHAPERAIRFEVAGLTELAAAAEAGGAAVAAVVEYGGSGGDSAYLCTSYIAQRAPNIANARAFGRRLAYTHAYLAPKDRNRLFGQAPADFEAETGYMGSISLPLVSSRSSRRSFGEFYSTDRIIPYLKLARERQAIDAVGSKIIEKLAEKLRDGDFDSPQPALVKSDAALLHGDLWSGNLLWGYTTPDSDVSAQAQKTHLTQEAHPEIRGILIDPASHGGHAESDLAQLGVFGAPFLADIYAGYQEVSPLASHWKERIGLHQLHMLCVHAALFGSSYGWQTVEIAKNYL